MNFLVQIVFVFFLPEIQQLSMIFKKKGSVRQIEVLNAIRGVAYLSTVHAYKIIMGILC